MMMHLHPDVAHTLVRDHMEQLRAQPEQWREVRQAGALRRAMGIALIRLGERVGGQRAQPVPPPAAARMAAS